MSVDLHWEKYVGWNPYNYSANNPLFLKDANGLDWFYYQKEGEKNKTWNWHEGSSYKGMKEGYQYLVKYTITGTSNGGVSGTLQVFKQNQIVAENKNVVSGGDYSHGGGSPADLGTYMMKLGKPGSNLFSLSPSFLASGKLATTYGLQYLGGYNQTSVSPLWGEGRIRLNKVDQITLKDDINGDRGLFLHSDYFLRGNTGGCVAEPINRNGVGNIVFDYFYNNGNGRVIGKVPFYITNQ